jgi:hypothetical protein
MANFFEDTLEKWDNLPGNQKIIVVGSIVAVGAFAFWQLSRNRSASAGTMTKNDPIRSSLAKTQSPTLPTVGTGGSGISYQDSSPIPTPIFPISPIPIPPMPTPFIPVERGSDRAEQFALPKRQTSPTEEKRLLPLPARNSPLPIASNPGLDDPVGLSPKGSPAPVPSRGGGTIASNKLV